MAWTRANARSTSGDRASAVLGATGADLPTKPGDLKVGSHLGRYRIDGPVGRGGMGVVYRAFDAATNRHVALKLLADGLPEALRERFLKECEAEARIRHEHVMPVYDQGWATDTRPYFTMELLYEPVTLDQVIDLARRGKLGSTWPRIRRWAHLPALVEDVLLPVIEGIAVANVDERIQHRDLKPENVLMPVDGRIRVLDFGLAQKIAASERRPQDLPTPSQLPALPPGADAASIARALTIAADPMSPTLPPGLSSPGVMRFAWHGAKPTALSTPNSRVRSNTAISMALRTTMPTAM